MGKRVGSIFGPDAGVSRIIVAHNPHHHPSGALLPEQDRVSETQSLLRALGFLGLPWHAL